MEAVDIQARGMAGEALAQTSQVAQDLADLSLTGGAGVTSENFTATDGQTVFPLTNTNGVIFAVVVENVIQTLSIGFTLNAAKNEATLTSGASLSDTVTLYYTVAVGGSSSDPIATYTHTGNIETYVTAVDVDTDTFTAVGHGLADTNKVYLMIKSGEPNVYLDNICPGGIVPATAYYVVNKAANTFQLSATSGGAAINLTTNANLDMTRFYFEKMTGVISSYAFTPLTAKKRYKARYVGRSFIKTGTNWVLPTGTNANGKWIGPNGNAYTIAYLLSLSNIWNDVITNIDGSNQLYVDYVGLNIGTNNTTTTIATRLARNAVRQDITNTDITSITFTIAEGIPNGTTLEIYDV